MVAIRTGKRRGPERTRASTSVPVLHFAAKWPGVAVGPGRPQRAWSSPSSGLLCLAAPAFRSLFCLRRGRATPVHRPRVPLLISGRDVFLFLTSARCLSRRRTEVCRSCPPVPGWAPAAIPSRCGPRGSAGYESGAVVSWARPGHPSSAFRTLAAGRHTHGFPCCRSRGRMAFQAIRSLAFHPGIEPGISAFAGPRSIR